MLAELHLPCDLAASLGAVPMRVDPRIGFPVVECDEFALCCPHCHSLYTWKALIEPFYEAEHARAQEQKRVAQQQSFLAKYFNWWKKK